MFGRQEMRTIREAVGAYAGGFDAALVSAGDAQRIVEDVIAAENMLAVVRSMAARRVSETELWRREGDASPAHQLARKSGTSVSKAREALETAGRLSDLPEVEAAARRGELSPSQVTPIADAASTAPQAGSRLLAAAKAASLGELLDACARTKAAALPDAGARHDAIHTSRFLRRRRTADGAGELQYRSTLEEVAEIFAIGQGWADRRFRAARTAGRHQPGEAYLAGLLDAVRESRVSGGGGGGAYPAGSDTPGGDTPGGGTAADERRGPGAHEPEGGACPFPELFADEAAARTPAVPSSVPAATRSGCPGPARPPNPAKVIVRIDLDALLRGWPTDGEVSEIAGLGPIAVSAVRAMISSGDVFLAAVVTKGVDVVNVAHLGRSATAYQQTGVEWMNPSCTTLGCNAVMRLENDHRVPWAESKVTLLAGLDRPCGRCHDLKTYRGWAYVEGAGKRPLVAPDDPRHPRTTNQGPAPPGGTGDG
jgi:hypothetical protein